MTGFWKLVCEPGAPSGLALPVLGEGDDVEVVVGAVCVDTRFGDRVTICRFWAVHAGSPAAVARELTERVPRDVEGCDVEGSASVLEVNVYDVMGVA